MERSLPKRDRMTKVGIIRCRQTEDICPGTTDFRCAAGGSGAFQSLGPCEITGFVSCGGCPGKRAVARAELLVKKGVQVIAFASCISRGVPNDWPCPHFGTMREAICKKVGPEIQVLDWTH